MGDVLRRAFETTLFPSSLVDWVSLRLELEKKVPINRGHDPSFTRGSECV